MHFGTAYVESAVLKTLIQRKKTSSRALKLRKPELPFQVRDSAGFITSRLQPSGTNDADEEGYTKEGGDDEAYKAEDVHPYKAYVALPEDA